MSTKRVLVAPLDWGLGHATRCIPIINLLLELKCDVKIAGSGASLALLKIEYPSLSFFRLPAYNPVYSSRGSMVVKLLYQLVKFFSVIKKEHSVLERIVRDEKIDIVISDNRFGCWSDHATSVFITHQLNIMMPKKLTWLSGIVKFFNHRFIKKYDLCWVPDNEQKEISGKLSDSATLKVNFIGLLSRFETCLPSADFKYKVLVVLSGPEPQRAILEKILIRQLSRIKLKSLVVRGLPGNSNKHVNDNLDMVDFLDTDQLNKAICESEIIVARSGYSTIMDLVKLGKRAILIPTPGQTEQEYLAKELHRKLIAYTEVQGKFDLEKGLEEVRTFKGFSALSGSQNLLNKTISELVK